MTSDRRTGPERPRTMGLKRWTVRTVQVLLLLVAVVVVIRSQPRSIEAIRASRADAEADARGARTPTAEESDPPEVDWITLGQLDYETGGMTPALEALVGTEVRVPGFMVPLDDDAEQVSEFLLVPYFGACVHTPAPPPNQLIYVRTPPGEAVTVEWWEPIWVRAELELDPTESVYGAVSWTMVARSVEQYEY